MNAAFTVIGLSSYNWFIGHQGLMIDMESGVVYNRARYLLVGLGTFGGRDRLGYLSGLNLYQLEYDNPLKWLDPSGLRLVSTQAETEAEESPGGHMRGRCSGGGRRSWSMGPVRGFCGPGDIDRRRNCRWWGNYRVKHSVKRASPVGSGSLDQAASAEATTSL